MDQSKRMKESQACQNLHSSNSRGLRTITGVLVTAEQHLANKAYHTWYQDKLLEKGRQGVAGRAWRAMD